MTARRLPGLLPALALALLASAPVRADVLTDGSLVVDIESNGEFNEVSLNGIEIDLSSALQTYLGSTCFGFTAGSAVNVVGAMATYTATCGPFDVAVTSTILGPIPGSPNPSDVLEQELVFTNADVGDQPLEILSNMDQDLAGTAGDDTVAYDGTDVSVFAVDDATPITLRALATTSDTATFGWDVDFLGGESVSFPTDDGVGPVGPGDTAMSIGFDFGTVPATESRTVTFRYEFEGTVGTLGHFLCYKLGIKSRDTVSLSDDFDSGVYDTKKFNSFCTPVDKNGEGIANASSHLSGFSLKGPHVKRVVSVTNQFGTYAYQTKKTDSLLVPTAVLSATARDVPRGASPPADISHFRCVKVKAARGAPKFAKQTVTLDDAFGSRSALLKKPSRLCVPTDKDGSGIPNTTQQLLCYKIKPDPKTGPFEVDVVNQFGSGFIRVKKEVELCVPSTLGKALD